MFEMLAAFLKKVSGDQNYARQLAMTKPFWSSKHPYRWPKNHFQMTRIFVRWPNNSCQMTNFLFSDDQRKTKKYILVTKQYFRWPRFSDRMTRQKSPLTKIKLFFDTDDQFWKNRWPVSKKQMTSFKKPDDQPIIKDDQKFHREF